jgi:hypothetical protein
MIWSCIFGAGDSNTCSFPVVMIVDQSNDDIRRTSIRCNTHRQKMATGITLARSYHEQIYMPISVLTDSHTLHTKCSCVLVRVEGHDAYEM